MFKLFRLLPAMLALYLCGGVALAAGEIEVYLQDDAARVTFATHLKQTGLDIDFGFLHSQDDGDLVHAGLYVAGFAGRGSSKFEVSLGGRVMLAETDFGDGTALGFGARVSYELPNVERLQLGAFAFYAPGSTSFGDVESILDIGAGVGYRVLERSTVFMLLTTTESKFGAGRESTIDSGVHFGFRARF